MNAPSTPPDLAAALAGSYELRHELGEGGTAVVYLARDLAWTEDGYVHSIVGGGSGFYRAPAHGCPGSAG